MWFDDKCRYEITEERHGTKLGHDMCVLCVIMWIDEWLYACVWVVLSDFMKYGMMACMPCCMCVVKCLCAW